MGSRGPKSAPPVSYRQTLIEEQRAAEAQEMARAELEAPPSEAAGSDVPVPKEETGEDGKVLATELKPAGKEPVSSGGEAAPEEPPNAIRYRVRSGDTLSEIAQRCGVPATEIAAANSIQVQDRILAGQTLVIPGVPEERVRALLLTPVKIKPAASMVSAPKPPKTGPRAPQIVLGSPAPKPAVAAAYPVSGLPAPIAEPDGGAPGGSPSRPVHLGPPVFLGAAPASRPGTAVRAVPGPATNPGSSLLAKRYPDEADYLPLGGTQQRETIMAASAVPVNEAETAERNGSHGPGGGSPSGDGSQSGWICYLVQPFDTLASIAKAHATTPERILQLNRIDSLREGQTILLPISHNRLAAPAVSR